jgi:hypothetical protein
MDPISNADRLVLLLRQKLQERFRAGGAAKPNARPGATAEPSGLHALAAIEGVEERQLRRAFVQNLLADQLGPELINDAKFQQVVSQVTEAIEDDKQTSRLLTRLIGELRGG